MEDVVFTGEMPEDYIESDWIEYQRLAKAELAGGEEKDLLLKESASAELLYHFADARPNIISWLPITRQNKVLEIGGQCGAVTTKLTDMAGDVTCIEKSYAYSRINALRNKKKSNLKIYVGNLEKVEKQIDPEYDYVFMIGTIEDISDYMPDGTTWDMFLWAYQHTKRGGKCVMAFDNPFGLKFWAGRKGRNMKRYFESLEGRLEDAPAYEWTKQVVEQFLKQQGIENWEFFYPYPNYTFTNSIYSDKYLPDIDETPIDPIDYFGDRLYLFNEKAVLNNIIKNELFPVFSNSYLMICEKG